MTISPINAGHFHTGIYNTNGVMEEEWGGVRGSMSHFIHRGIKKQTSQDLSGGGVKKWTTGLFISSG